MTRRNPVRPAEPGWAEDPPPATLPTIPPIRSAQLDQMRPQPPARRDAHTALVTPPGSPRKPVPAPTIITGDGHVSHVRPLLRRTQPRSRAMRAALVSFATCIVLAVLFAATPITAGATGQITSFIAGSRTGDLPTATPTATATLDPTVGGGPGTGYNPGSAAIIAEIQAVFGPYSAGALAVAHCESGYDPNAWNPITILGSHAEGVFQILYPSTWDNTAYAGYSPYNAWANIHAAHDIFARDGNTWREWECQP
jgi:hypothetical protein